MGIFACHIVTEVITLILLGLQVAHNWGINQNKAYNTEYFWLKQETIVHYRKEMTSGLLLELPINSTLLK